VLVAISIDTNAFRNSLPPAVLQAASRLRLSGRVGDLERVGGGIQAVVRDESSVYQPWAGVVDRTFVSECECADADGEELCPHAVAVVLTGLDQSVAWSGTATPPSTADITPAHQRFSDAVGRLAPRQLADLIISHAARDRLFATGLLRAAGMLDTSDNTALRAFRNVLHEVSYVTNGHRWDIHDVETAGKSLAAEAEILSAHPATVAALDLVEQAILAWDELSGFLHDAHYERSTDPEEINEPLVEVHLALCERLGLDPQDIADRVTNLVSRCGYDTVDTSVYADLLGDELMSRSRLW
jgi:hypothetical protein